MSLLERFENSLLSNRLIRPGDQVYVACSGGPDSVALFYLLNALAQKWKLRIGLLHVNHGWRGRASVQDEKFVRRLSRKFKIPFKSKRTSKGKIKNGLSPEERARKARYAFFSGVAQSGRGLKIATAHTREDQAETVLMRVIQGTGLRGLSGIRSKRTLGKGMLVRPLLDFSKKELLRFLKENRIPYCHDATNFSTCFLRNRIRHKLLPVLEREFNPRVIQAIARIPQIVEEENQLLNEVQTAAWKRVVRSKRRNAVYLSRKIFLNLPPALQFRTLDRALRILDEKSGASFDAWQRLRPCLHQKRCRISFPCDIDFEMTPKFMRVYKKCCLISRKGNDRLYRLFLKKRGK